MTEHSDPRRLGHRLTYIRTSAVPGAPQAVVGRCTCSPAVEFRCVEPTLQAGLARVWARHAAHVEQAEGPVPPALTRVQEELLLSCDPERGVRSTSRRWRTTVAALHRLGLIERVAGQFRDSREAYRATAEGRRVAGLLRRARGATPGRT